MTTIICDGKSMGCDGQISSGNNILETEYVKIHKLPDGSIVGFAGNAYNWLPLLTYFQSKSRKKRWPQLDGSLDIVHLKSDGTIFTYDALGRPFQQTAPVCAGSGWKFALAAMDLGNDIKTAISAAIKRDPFSSGKITILTLGA